jgi:hypothetical protein
MNLKTIYCVLNEWNYFYGCRDIYETKDHVIIKLVTGGWSYNEEVAFKYNLSQIADVVDDSLYIICINFNYLMVRENITKKELLEKLESCSYKEIEKVKKFVYKYVKE